jgi:streptogramin lyase
VVDADGQLWLTLQTRELLRFVGGKFDIMDVADGLPERQILRLFQSPRGLVVETAKGTVVWNGREFVADPAMQPPPEAALLTFAGISAGFAARWYRDDAGRAYRYSGERLTRTLDLAGRGVYEDRSGRVWTLQDGGDLTSMAPDGTVMTYGRQSGMVGMGSWGYVEDPDGTMWFFSTNGLARFREGRFRSFTTADGLPDNWVRIIFRDREGTHWVGTNTGLTRLVEQPIVSFTAADGLEADNTYPLLQDRDGAIWIGGWPGLTRYKDGVFERVAAKYKLFNRMGRPLNVLSLMEARDGAIWVGAVGGLKRISPDRTETVDVPTNFSVH